MSCYCDGCEKYGCLKKVPIFNSLSSDEFTNLLNDVKPKIYKKGETIFSEGGEASTFYFISEGNIKLYKYNKYGKEQILHILSEGDFFGELNLLINSNYTFNSKAILDCKLCTLSKGELKNMIMKYPEIGIKLLEVVGKRLEEAESLVQNISTKDGDSRMAYLLMDFAEKYGENIDDNIVFKLPISRDDMANFTGLSRETISRKLKSFQEKNLIKLVGTRNVVILDEDALREYI